MIPIDTFSTSSIPIDSRSSLRPLKDVKPISSELEQYALGIILIVILVGTVFLIRRYFKSKLTLIKKILKKEEDPYQWAEKKMVEIEQNLNLKKAPYQNYFIKLSELIREFILRESQIDALKKTSRSVLEEYSQKKSEKDIKLKILPDLLKIADRVKFSGFLPDLDLVDAYSKSAREFIRKSNT